MTDRLPRALRALLPALLLLAPALGAQTSPRTVRSQANAWLIASADVWATPRWGLQTELMYERSELGAAPQQIEYRLGAQHLLRSGARLAAGGTYIHNSPYGPFPARVAFDEYRAWEQATVDQRVGVASLSHRYRLEQRWIDRPVLGAAGQSIGHDASYTMRARYQLRGTVPITPASRPRSLYASGSEEVFLGLGPHTPLNLLDQNRLSLGLGARWSPALRTELGYLNQIIVRADGRQIEENHTLLLTVGFTRAAPRR